MIHLCISTLVTTVIVIFSLHLLVYLSLIISYVPPSMSDSSSSNSSLLYMLTSCYDSRTTLLIFTALTNAVLLIPLVFFVVYFSFQRWRQRPFRSVEAVISHSDFFTYNMAALELINIFSSCLYCFSEYAEGNDIKGVTQSAFCLISPGQTLFHLLTCVERYLAVVHPVTYLGLRQKGGILIRNICSGCVWLLGLLLVCLTKVLSSIFLTITSCCIMVSSLILVSFCSFSVLRVLKHPWPGEVKDGRERVDQSKKKAFYTIVAIMVTELFRLVGILICAVMFDRSVLNEINCAVGSSMVWLAVPCGLVLPLLFLQRAGKLPGCKNKVG